MCPLCASHAVQSETIDATTDHDIVQPLTIRLLGFNFFGGRIQPLVIVRKSRLLARQLDALFDKQFAIGIFSVDQVPADEIIPPLAVSEDFAIEIDDGDVEISIVKP